MRKLLLIAAIVLVASSSAWAGTWTNLANTPESGVPYGSWSILSNNMNTDTWIWTISYGMTVNPASPYRLENITAFITFAQADGHTLTNQGNGLWTGSGYSASYLGPDSATQRMLDPTWSYASLYAPTDFSKSYVAIDLGSSDPGDTGVMTWTVAWSGLSQSGWSMWMGSQVFADVVPVPEPSSVLALLTGLAGISGVVIRRRS